MKWKREIIETFENSQLTFYPLRASMGQWLRDDNRMHQLDDDYKYFIMFGRGSYDNWAAIVLRQNNSNKSEPSEIAFPRDEYYFSRLGILALDYGRERVYEDVEAIYYMVEDNVRKDHLKLIQRLSERYGADKRLAYDMFLHIYYGMIAEEHYQRRWSHDPDNSQRTLVGKLMKLHGLYRFLIEKVSLSVACKECINVSPSLILWRMEERGYHREAPLNAYITDFDLLENQPIIESGAKKSW